VNIVLRNIGTRVKKDNAIIVIVNTIVLNPGETGLNTKDTLSTREVDVVVVDNCV
jgi:hypothetical protein